MGHWDHKKTRRLIRALITQLEVRMSEATDRLDAALTGLTGDIASLKAAAVALQAALDEALADQEAAVQEAVAAAVAAFNAELEPLVARAEALDAETPEA
jgi:hypothetical protein